MLKTRAEPEGGAEAAAAWLGEISEVSNYDCLCLLCGGNWRIMPRGRRLSQPCERNKQVMEVVPESRPH